MKHLLAKSRTIINKAEDVRLRGPRVAPSLLGSVTPTTPPLDGWGSGVGGRGWVGGERAYSLYIVGLPTCPPCTQLYVFLCRRKRTASLTLFIVFSACVLCVYVCVNEIQHRIFYTKLHNNYVRVYGLYFKYIMYSNYIC